MSKNKSQMIKVLMAVTAITSLVACEMTEVVRRHAYRSIKPGTLNPNAYFVKHKFRFMNRYLVEHEWVRLNERCFYGGYLGEPKGAPLRVLDSLGEIFEQDGKTWYRRDKSYGYLLKNGQVYKMDFDEYVRSVIAPPSAYEDGRGVMRMTEAREDGLKPLCFDTWWVTSNYMRMSLQKRDMTAYKAFFSKKYPEGKWSQETVGLFNHGCWP